MKSLVSRLRRPGVRRDEGASAVEYGLLVALIAVIIALAVGALGTALRGTIEKACDEVGGTPASCAGGGGGPAS
jgi:pilus assembly protein Flp/PilA